MTVWFYVFEDGTRLELLNIGLSNGEIWKLTELHGNLVDNGAKRL